MVTDGEDTPGLFVLLSHSVLSVKLLNLPKTLCTEFDADCLDAQ